MSYQPLLKKIRNYIEQFEKRPDSDIDKIKNWFSFKDVGYLIEETQEDWVMLYLITDDYFLNSFLIEDKYNELYQTPDATKLNFGLATCSSSYVSNFKDNWLEKSYRNGFKNSKMYPIFFSRDFDGYEKEKRSYYELLQGFLHVSDLHWVESKMSYCNLNDVGDVEEKVVVIDEDDFTCILADRVTLETYMGYGSFSLMRFFEVKRYLSKPAWGMGSQKEVKILSSEDKTTFIRYRPNSDESVVDTWCDMARGSNLVTPRRSIQEIEELEKTKEYASFIIQDWKNNCEVEWSSSPEELDSYFVETGKPFETSPAFFHPDVLLKYKGDPDKYEFNQRRIYCRGAWSLKTYDINDEGQVHTYICYLGYLPYKEQLHWKQYNEKPKGKISERAYETDFMAEWVTEYNPLSEIKSLFNKFPSYKGTPIWLPKEPLDELNNKVHYVTSGKVSEYKDFLLGLTILVVDGLQTKSLSGLVKDEKGYDKQMKSLGLLRLLLVKENVEASCVAEIIKPLRDLQTKRSKFGGHGGAKPDYDMVEDCRLILESVEKSLSQIFVILKETNE